MLRVFKLLNPDHYNPIYTGKSYGKPGVRLRWGKMVNLPNTVLAMVSKFTK
jgi:hypothetical protein